MDIWSPKPPIEANLGFESGAGWEGAAIRVVEGGLDVENSMVDDTVNLYADMGSALSSAFIPLSLVSGVVVFSAITFSIRNPHFLPLYPIFGNSNPSYIYFDSTAMVSLHQPQDCATGPPTSTHHSSKIYSKNHFHP